MTAIPENYIKNALLKLCDPSQKILLKKNPKTPVFLDDEPI